MRAQLVLRVDRPRGHQARRGATWTNEPLELAAFCEEPDVPEDEGARCRSLCGHP